MPTAGGDQKSQRESLILEGHGFSRAANSTALAGEIGLGNRGLIGDSFLRAPSREGLERAAGRTGPPLRFAPVGMTILLPGSDTVPLHLFRPLQNCHPDRSVLGFPTSR